MTQRQRQHALSPWAAIQRVVTLWVGAYIGLLAGGAALSWPRLLVHHATGLLAGGLVAILSFALLTTIHHVVYVRLVRPLERRAEVDALTGIWRPDAFWARARQLTQQAAMMQTPWVFAFIDLDDFKQINDTVGHAVGDQILRAFGTLLRQHARKNDVVGRIGGEEFGWVLSGCSPEEAMAPLQRLLAACKKIDATALPHSCTFSAGVASVHGDLREEPDVEAVARQADRALYQAKTHGKGCIFTDISPTPKA